MKFKKTNFPNYRLVAVPCCVSCKHGKQGYDFGDLYCSIHVDKDTKSGWVDTLGCCDDYE